MFTMRVHPIGSGESWWLPLYADIMAGALAENPLYEGFRSTRRAKSLSALISFTARCAWSDKGMVLRYASRASFAVVLDGYNVGWWTMLRSGILKYSLQMGLREAWQIFRFSGRAEEKFRQVSEAYGIKNPWYVPFIATQPSQQGEGYGGEILEALKRVATRDRRAIYLESQEIDANRFYLEHGFQLVGFLYHQIADLPAFQTYCFLFVPQE